MRGAIKEQEGAARAGLEFLQVSANKAALEAMCKDQAEAIAQAQDVALDGKLCTCDRRTLSDMVRSDHSLQEGESHLAGKAGN